MGRSDPVRIRPPSGDGGTGLRALALRRPARTLAAVYFAFALVGWGLLALPISQARAFGAADALFLAASGISTTGLFTANPATHLTGFGQAVLLLLIQVGGLGVVALIALSVLALRRSMGSGEAETARREMQLREGTNVAGFLRRVLILTLACEAAGFAVLWWLFAARGVEGAWWHALFHSVSAFCTAGFSTFEDNLQGFAGSPAILGAVALSCLIGGIGFVVILDRVSALRGEDRPNREDSRILMRATAIVLAFGTAALIWLDPALGDLPRDRAVLASAFQAVSAMTTTGFSSEVVPAFGPGAWLVLIFLMVGGAAPVGTGSGLRLTSLAALIALTVSKLRGRRAVRFLGSEVSDDRVRTATTGLTLYLALLLAGLIALFALHPRAPFGPALFDAVSAISTVGLTAGFTAEVGDAGKVLMAFLMVAGRIGLLTFAVAVVSHGGPRRRDGDDDGNEGSEDEAVDDMDP